MPELPPELLLLAPLALAAGIDLYFTLIFIGAAPTTSWWSQPLPGALGDLDSAWVLIVAGAFYILEFLSERHAPTALLWNAFHAVIRPLAGALLALLLLDGSPLVIVVPAALAAGLLASLAHAVRSGGAIVRWLGSVGSPRLLLVSLFEDVLALGLLALALDAPLWGSAVALTLAGFTVIATPSQARAFGLAVRLVMGRAFEPLTERRWMAPEEFPAWVRRSLEGDVLAPGGGLRGKAAGAHRLPGAPRFATGWVVVRGSSPLFVFRRRAGAGTVDLGALTGERVLETGFFRRVDLRSASGTPVRLFFSLNGPSEESLRAEFLID